MSIIVFYLSRLSMKQQGTQSSRRLHIACLPHCKGALPAEGTGGVAAAGLVGDGWLHLLELAKRNVVQPGAAVVPAAATLYCAGVELPPSSAAGFDLTALDKYRCGSRR